MIQFGSHERGSESLEGEIPSEERDVIRPPETDAIAIYRWRSEPHGSDGNTRDCREKVKKSRVVENHAKKITKQLLTN